MEFWNDYEGKTVAAFPLRKLLRPEGRSAFFSTVDSDGNPAILRLTESLHDQDELVERWRQITELAQPNLITLRCFGATAYDGVPLTYALMEAPDASLADILCERPLTPDETLQVALAVTEALSSLHNAAFTHEHVEAASVFAIGETIKLRSDCIRECIADPEFLPEEVCQQRRQRDIHDLGVLLLQCLTLEKSLTPSTRLAGPFDQIIRRALDGSWTLTQIANTLIPPPIKPIVPAEVLGAGQASELAEARPIPEAEFSKAPLTLLAEDDLPAQQQLPLRSYEESSYEESRFDAGETIHRFPVWARNPRIWVAAAVASLLIFMIAHIHSSPTADAAPQMAAVTTPAVAVAPHAERATPTQTNKQPGWRVIVYTYTKEAQAFAKAAAIQANHPDLQAQVFAHNRHAPFLVSLGGPMSREEADAMLHKARRAGLPRDSFVRLYNNS